MALPTPVLSDGDIIEAQSSSVEFARLIRSTWSQDPIKAAVLRAVLSCQAWVVWQSENVRRTFSVALGQRRVCPLHRSLLKEGGVHYLNFFRTPKKFMISSSPWRHILAHGIDLAQQVSRLKNREDLSPLACCALYTYRNNRSSHNSRTNK